MRLFPKDATTTGEKLVYIIGWGIPIVLYLFALTSAMGIFENFYSEACEKAGWGWKALGLAFTIALVFNLVKGFTQPEKAPSNLILFALLILSLLSYCGFAYPYYIG